MASIQKKGDIMKIILSRKGFDSNIGKTTSPIFENGDMISFPIPEKETEGVSKEEFSMLQYNGIDLSELLNQLGYGRDKNQVCHIDPDLVKDRRVQVVDGWNAIFGQCDSAAMYLNNQSVNIGDIFLFFGNFHHVTEYDKGLYKKTRKRGDFYKDNDIQVIWGYLQVGEIIPKEKQQNYKWHPHSMDYYVNNKTNTMYKANEKLSFNPNKDGYGIFKFSEHRVLTERGYSKANWKKDQVYLESNICGNRHNSSKKPENTIYYQGQWQELVLKESKECEDWAKKIIEE
jgi:hypothetical protein